MRRRTPFYEADLRFMADCRFPGSPEPPADIIARVNAASAHLGRRRGVKRKGEAALVHTTTRESLCKGQGNLFGGLWWTPTLGEEAE